MISPKDALESLRWVVANDAAEHNHRNFALNLAHLGRLVHYFEINPPYGDASDDLENLMRGGLTVEDAHEFQSLEQSFFDNNGRDIGAVLECASNYVISFIANTES